MLKFFNGPKTIKPLSRKKQSIRHLILWGALTLTINSVHAIDSDEKPKPNTYILKTGKEGAARLDLQDRFLETLSRKHLEDAGLSPGYTVWDIGCGSGVKTVDLAKRVGPTGRVHALDKSKKQLEVAREKIKSEGLENVEFIEEDVISMSNLPTQKADLVYMRFVLMHVNDPKTAIYNIRNLLKPGGVVVSQEPIMSSSIHTNLPGYIETLSAWGTKQRVDYDIGNRLASLYEEAGFSCTVESHRPMLTPRQAKGVHLLGLAEWKDEAIRANLLKQQQVDKWVGIINSWPEEGDITPIYTPPTNVYVIAKKE